MNVKVVPVRIEVNAKNPEEPLKVEYLVELNTEIYSDFIGSGVTYLSDPEIVAAVDSLVSVVTKKVGQDLGLEVKDTDNIKPDYSKEEDL